MKLFNIVFSSIIQILSLIFLLGFLLGILNMYFSDKKNYCEMTYMFEYPQFVRISVEENDLYPQYGLYAYSEGRFTEKARKMWFDGIPVLFLPGNSGSHMQARSLASVALRKAISKGYEYHFDFFTISYNEEYSGLYGGVLESQTEFAALCIPKILSLYKANRYTKSVPTSVFLIGHSMGGVVAKRLMAYQLLNTTATNVVITLAAPLSAPVINFDDLLNSYYFLMYAEWQVYIAREKQIEDKKLLISIGSGPRDVLVPADLTFSDKSYINALATAIPGVWVSPDHVSMVWCKQLVLAINRYLFDIVDPKTHQISEDRNLLEKKAKQYFQANRSTTIDQTIQHLQVPMTADGFWYEDNRRIYQIARPSIDRPTYLMIRLINFPQNRFVAIESVNVDDKDWIFGCNAMYIHNSYRYCKQATSLGEMSRWTGAAEGFGRRKLATIDLHSVRKENPDWSHVIVRVSPTRKPIVLNVDINDLASREVKATLPSTFSFSKLVIMQETEPNSLYYEIKLPGFNMAHQAFLLYVEPTDSCQPTQYHVSAEQHAPWAKNQEHYHYFTHLKRSPMKLRLSQSDPNLGLNTTEYVKVTLLLDPQCKFKISISNSWYHRLAQFARLYPSVLISFVTASVVLMATTNVKNMNDKGTFVSVHTALMNDKLKLIAPLSLGRFILMGFFQMQTGMLYFYKTSGQHHELLYFLSSSILLVPAYLTALGILNIVAAAVVAIMVFSSQLAHRLLFRIMWRGGTGLAEHVASGLKRVPLVVSAVLLCISRLSCGAAAIAVGVAFYAFMISKMYEEYLEDYVYKLMAKIASRICRIFKSEKKVQKNESETSLALPECSGNAVSIPEKSEKVDEKSKAIKKSNTKKDKKDIVKDSNTKIDKEKPKSQKVLKKDRRKRSIKKNSKTKKSNENRNKEQDELIEVDEDLNALNYHMTMFFMWMTVGILNIPVLLTWARNFKYSMVLNDDTSYYTGVLLSLNSAVLFQQGAPKPNLRHYDSVVILLYLTASMLVIIGPLSLATVNYAVTFMIILITMQQFFDTLYDDDDDNYKGEDPPEDDSMIEDVCKAESDKEELECTETEDNVKDKSGVDHEKKGKEEEKEKIPGDTEQPPEDCNVCSESRIYTVFKNLREKLSFNDDA